MILSDNWLRAQSEKPTHIVHKLNGGVEYASAPFTPSQANLLRMQGIYKLTPISTYVGNEPPAEIIESGMPAVRVSEIREITPEELTNWKPMIEPFANRSVKEEDGKRLISYGLSSYGYDLRIGNKFKIFTNINSTVIDPKNFDTDSFVDFEGDVCIIPPNSFVLAASVEYIRMPRNVTGVVLGKSTYARTGIVCIATPLEAEWEGHVTLEFANTTPLPAMLYANEGAAQVLFFEGEDCLTSYMDRGGKYQFQESGPVLPKV